MAREAKFLQMGKDNEAAGDAASASGDYEKAKKAYGEAVRFFKQAGASGDASRAWSKQGKVATPGAAKVLEKKAKGGIMDAHFGSLKDWAKK